MVQRKETTKHAPHAEPRQSSSQSKGTDSLKKKLKMERSIMAADLESLRGIDVKPNYMKPTRCSAARAERPHVKNSSETRAAPKSSPDKIRHLIMKSLKGVVFNRATCSSTLKHSKFPKALELSPGGTEAEGTSVVKVCPYSYCSLNGHWHEPLPPLKQFVSARRKLLKAQKSLKLKVGVGKGKKGIGTGGARPIEEVCDDFLIEIYTETPELISEVDTDYEGVDVMENFLEYVECEQPVELHTESCQADEADTFELGSEDGAESSYPDSKTECSECSDDDFGFPTLFTELLPVEKTIFPDESETAAAEDDAVSNPNSESYEPESSTGGDSYLGFKDFHEPEDAETEVALRREDSAENEICDGETEDKHDPSDVENTVFYYKSDYIDPELMKARLKITRKKMIEDVEVMKEFNPRGPRFLEVEADPEGEKVDLRHQMMDERKNSEEWMIDYALRQAVMKMAPARKRKVALLVEAFETVAPLPVWGNPSRHDSSGLTLARIIQACN